MTYHEEKVYTRGADEQVESDPLAKMSSATAPQAAIGIVADKKEEKVEEPLAARALRISGTLATERHDTHSPTGNGHYVNDESTEDDILRKLLA